MTQPEVLIQVLEILKNSRKFCFVYFHFSFTSVMIKYFVGVSKSSKQIILVCLELQA